MNVLITGGTGLIGRALSENLVKDGHRVVVLTRDTQKVNGMPPNVVLARWDGRSSEGWGHLVNEVDAIVNLAGENLSAGLWTEARKQRIRSSRIDAGRAVVQAIESAAQKPAVVIQASGIGFYGVKNPDAVTENDLPGNDFLADVSRDWEASTQPVEAMGVRRAIIRTGVVLSRKGGALRLMLLPFKFFVGGPLGSGRQWLSWIHIEDEVRAIRFLLENGKAGGPFNLAAQSVTNVEFSRAVGKVMGRPSFIKVPAFALRLVLGEMATMVLDGQRAAPQKLTDLGFSFTYNKIQDALASLV